MRGGAAVSGRGRGEMGGREKAARGGRKEMVGGAGVAARQVAGGIPAVPTEGGEAEGGRYG